jgi:hypothetical protein
MTSDAPNTSSSLLSQSSNSSRGCKSVSLLLREKFALFLVFLFSLFASFLFFGGLLLFGRAPKTSRPHPTALRRGLLLFLLFLSASSSVMRAASASSSATRASSASSASILPCSAAAASSASSAIRSSSSLAVFSLYMRSYSSRSFFSHLSRTLFSVGVSFLDVGLTVHPQRCSTY